MNKIMMQKLKKEDKIHENYDSRINWERVKFLLKKKLIFEKSDYVKNKINDNIVYIDSFYKKAERLEGIQKNTAIDIIKSHVKYLEDKFIEGV